MMDVNFSSFSVSSLRMCIASSRWRTNLTIPLLEIRLSARSMACSGPIVSSIRSWPHLPPARASSSALGEGMDLVVSSCFVVPGNWYPTFVFTYTRPRIWRKRVSCSACNRCAVGPNYTGICAVTAAEGHGVTKPQSFVSTNCWPISPFHHRPRPRHVLGT